MTGAIIRRLAICAVALGLIFVSQNVFAQTGSVKGKVVDAQGNAVDSAEVDILSLDHGGKPLVTKTKKDGTYMQVGLAPGQYKISVSKGDLSAVETVRIGLDMATHDVKLTKGGAAAGAPNPKIVAAQKAFDEAVTLSNGDDVTKYDEAIAKFEEAANTMTPAKCGECYSNIGTVQLKQAAKLKDADAQGKKLDEAEASFKKALDEKPDMADAYIGLANLYNAEKKFDQAAEASKKAMELSGAGTPAGAAAGGGSASAYYNQGVILWNASKFPEAKAQFEQSVKLDANNPEAQYMLAMAYVNGGDTASAKPHFEAYLKLAPTGDHADMVKSILASIK